MEKLYVIDASGYLYRSYFAIRNITNDQGESTNALFGFIRSILKLFNDFHPDHIIAVFDGPKSKQLREAIYPQYKAHRKEMPEDMRYQIKWAQDFCDLMGIPKLVIPGFEADDTMGAIAKWGSKQGANIFLCTGDKDLCQLVDDHVFILNTHKDNLILDKEKVEEVYGVFPEQIIDFLAITGDASDNIPGIAGFGPKTAIKLLQEAGTLEKILSHPEMASGKKKQETLVKEADIARLSQKLVTINTTVEIPLEDTFYQLGHPDKKKLIDFYTYMNFSSLIKELEEKSPKKLEKESVTYHLVDTEEQFQNLLMLLSKEPEVCFDTETTHLKPLEAELVGIGFCVNPKEAYYVPTNGKLGLQRVLEGVKPLFENPHIGFYGHNVKYDFHILKNYEITVKNISFDTILASYILNSHLRQHSLDALSLKYFGKVKTPISDLIGKGKKATTIDNVPIEKVCQYCCEDVDYTLRLKKRLSEDLTERNLQTLYYDLELPLLLVLAKMERSGIFLDIPVLQKMSSIVNEQIQRLTQEIYLEAGEEFNLNSPKQLSHILFEKLGIKPPKKTTTGYSTNAAVLESLKMDYPIAEKIIKYRTVEKLRSTYIETLPLEVNPKTHRIHPTFNQSVAATGRLSCQDPNLQNIPVRTDIGRQIRKAFRPEKEDWSYLSSDYSQIELRLLAHLSEDPNLIDAFIHGEDIHSHTAATILNIPIKDVTKQQRYHAKAVNFGILYGQQAFGLSKELQISVEEAKNFIEMYFDRFKRVKEFIEYCKEEARKTGKAVTITGRERAIPEINNKNIHIRNLAERIAVNTPLQGTAADLIKLAMINLDKKLAQRTHLGYMVLQIHDELIFEVPDHEVAELESLVKKEMEGVYTLRVSLVVDISLGKNWEKC